jgi:hypothetical protein
MSEANAAEGIRFVSADVLERYTVVCFDIENGHKIGVRQESLGKEEGMSEVT